MAYSELVQGIYETAYGDVRFTYAEDVKLEGTFRLNGCLLRIAFFVRKCNDDWVRDGTHGSAMIEDTKTKFLLSNPAAGPLHWQDAKGTNQGAEVRFNAKELKDVLAAIRDGWRAYIKANPAREHESVRNRARSILEMYIHEREGIQYLLDRKSEEIRLMEEVVAADDPAVVWRDVERRWPKPLW